MWSGYRVPADKEPKSTDTNEPKEASVIKPAKKLIIVDGNEASAVEPEKSKTAAKKIAILHDDDTVKDKTEAEPKAGDTPKLTDTSELTSLAEAITATTQEDANSTSPATDTEVDESKVAEDQTSDTPQADAEQDTSITVGDAIAAAGIEQEESATANDIDISDESAAASDSTAEETSIESQVETETNEPSSQAEPTADDKEFSDDKTADAVDDIVATESDELLQRQDAEKSAPVIAEKKKSKIGTLFKNWWVNPATKWGTIVGLLLTIALITLLPASRYAILNAAGVRAKTSLTVMSNESQQPLKNAEVSIANQTKSTDDEGKVAFEGLKLGKQALKIKKSGYATIQKDKVLGWGSNPLGKVGMSVTGTKFSFVAKDFLSSKALASAEAISGDFNATADNEGRIILSIDQLEDKDFTVTIKAPDYRDEIVTIKPNDTAEKTVQMVPAKQHVFVSKRTGKFDVYKIDADGKNEAVLVAATGSEREDLSLLSHPTRQYVALVSTREGKRNKDGYLLSGIYIVNVANGESQKIGQSERIQLIDWSGDRLVYIGIVDGVSAANPARSKLYSYEIGQPGAKELASANYFNDASVFKGSVYYAPSSYAVPVSSAKFYKTNPDGSGTTVVLDKEVWSILRNDYDTLYLSVQQDWYELKQNGTPSKMSGAPTNLRTKVYRDNFDKSLSLWTDQRDGKGILLAYNVSGKKDDTLETKAGLTQPASWLNNTTYVYRVSDSREVADYVKSTLGGDAKKVRDVTNTDMSYYYN